MEITSPFDRSFVFRAMRANRAAKSSVLPSALGHPHIGRAASRRLEFDLGRRAALAALSELGYSSLEIAKRADGSPDWPAGVTGSISHTEVDGEILAVAAITSTPSIASVGLDIERIRQVNPKLLGRIASPGEVAWANAADTERRTIMIFSAREALYKAIVPLYRASMRYRETVLEWADDLAGFRAVTHLPHRDGATIALTIRIVQHPKLVVAGVVLSRANWSATAPGGSAPESPLE